MNDKRWLRHGIMALLIGIGCCLFPAAGSAWQAPAETLGWHQWRGPYRTGQTAGSLWPDSLEPPVLERLWRVELQPSYSGPIVSGDRVFVTETVNEQLERVTALGRQKGDKIWSQEWAGSMNVPFFARSRGDWIRSTPACDGQTLYVAGMRDVLVALDAASGQERWRVDFVQKLGTPLPDFGFVCSPLVDGKAVYVQAGAGLVKLNAQTGEILWRSLQDDGGIWGSAFSSPVIADVAGVRQLVVQARDKLAGVSPDTGQVLWSQEVPAFRGMNILTPTLIDRRIFTSSYGGKSFLYQLDPQGDQFQVSEMWTNKVQGYMSSPVVIDQHVYLHLRNRRFTCIDLATGKEKWITKPFGEYWSLISQGDRILALDEQGELLLIRGNPEQFELRAQKKISDESTWAHLAHDTDQLFVRDLAGLTAYRWSLTPSSPAATP